MLPDEHDILFSLAQVAWRSPASRRSYVLVRSRRLRTLAPGAGRPIPRHGSCTRWWRCVLLLPLLIGVFTSDRNVIWNLASALLGAEIVGHVRRGIVHDVDDRRAGRSFISIGYLIGAVQFMNVAGVVFDPIPRVPRRRGLARDHVRACCS
jgi:hypothetical protein